MQHFALLQKINKEDKKNAEKILSNFFPKLELILFNFYEIFHDIFLFLKDLIKQT